MRFVRSLRLFFVLVLAGLPGAVSAFYLPVWLMQEKFDYVIDVTNRGLRIFPIGDSSRVATYAVTVREIMDRRPEASDPGIAPGDSILVLARGNWLKDDREGYLLFVIPQERRSYPGLPLPLFEGKAMPCDRRQRMFTMTPPTCDTQREPGADFCACIREAVRKHRDLVAARETGEEDRFLRESLKDGNAAVVLSAMGLLRKKGNPESVEWMRFLVDHPEYQVRYDLAESLPYLAGEAAGQVGIRMLDDPDPAVQLVAGYSLGLMKYETAAPLLAAILVDPSRERRVRAICIHALDGMDSDLLLPALEKAVSTDADSILAKGFRIHLEKQRAKVAGEK